MKKFLKNNWPLVFLFFLNFLLLLANFVPGTYLIGWDSTVPELNLNLNLERFIFGVWQEYRGLGTLDGMAHTANIMHWFYSALLSLVLPTNLVRYVLTIIAHFLGGLGSYYLTNKVLSRLWSQENSFIRQIASLLAALLYQYNFMTIQMFYAPLEVFSTHFALLPWGVLTTLNYLRHPTKRSLFFFFLVNLLGISQAHVPSVFISYLILIFVILFFDLIISKFKSLQKIINLILIIFVVNAFWGLPYVYSTFSKAAEISSSTINRLSTDEIFLRNLAWGDLKSVLTFGSFNLDYLDWNNQTAQFEQMLTSWLSTYQSANFQTINIALTLFSLLGLVLAILNIRNHKKKKRFIWPLTASLTFFLSQLAIDTSIIKGFSIVLRNKIPFYHDIFRFTFTKFSLAYVMLLSVFFGIAAYKVSDWLKKRFHYFTPVLFLTPLIISLAIIAYPAFEGKFLYHRLRVTIPNAYFEAMEFFKTQPKQTRISLWPSPSLYGWHHHEWGYRGSGFIWQIIPQPITDRAFDAWSASNETFYKQLQYALKQQDMALIESVLGKYRVNYILLDKSVVTTEKGRQSQAAQEAEAIIEKIGLEKIWERDFLSVYKTKNNYSSFVSIIPSYTPANNYNQYASYDPIYTTYGGYLVTDDLPKINFPLSYLMQNRIQEKLNFQENSLKFTIQANQEQILVLPGLKNLKYYSPVSQLSYHSNQLVIEFKPAYSIKVGQKEHQFKTLPTQNIPVFDNPQELIISINDQIIELKQGETITTQLHSLEVGKDIEIFYFDKAAADYNGKEIIISPTDLGSHQIDQSHWQNLIPETNITLDEKNATLILATLKNDWLIKLNKSDLDSCGPNTTKSGQKTNYDGKIVFESRNGSICDQLNLKSLSTTAAHLLVLQEENLANRDLKIFIKNQASNQLDLEETLKINKSSANYPQVIFGLFSWPNYLKNSYLVNFENKSFGHELAKNKLAQFESYSLPLPFKWLASIELVGKNFQQIQSQGQIEKLDKIGSSFYAIKLKFENNKGLINLSQSYECGWLALSHKTNKSYFSLANYKKLPHHRFNGWANAWEVPAGEHQIIIFYWPQLLVFGGYLLLIVTGSYLIYRVLRK